jgi:hypothetical protein
MIGLVVFGEEAVLCEGADGGGDHANVAQHIPLVQEQPRHFHREPPKLRQHHPCYLSPRVVSGHLNTDKHHHHHHQQQPTTTNINATMNLNTTMNFITFTVTITTTTSIIIVAFTARQ